MKFTDLVEFNIAQITYKARNNLLPGYTQKMFFDREGGYNLRGKFKFTTFSQVDCSTFEYD